MLMAISYISENTVLSIIVRTTSKCYHYD